MSMYGETKAKVFAVALSVSDLKSRIENLDDRIDGIQVQLQKNLKVAEVLDTQLEDLFQHIRDNFSDEEVAMIGKENEETVTETKSTEV
tara:strand:+ start:956 stop:1222 length:267 start_codon:yes stop_codon:yes gene_type:complete